MIKINLLPQKRAKRSAVPGLPKGTTDDGTKQFMIGVGALVAAAALVFFVVDMPKRSARSDYEAKTKQLNGEIAAKKQKLVGYESLKAEVDNAVIKVQAINRLIAAKVVPANVLHELGQIMSTRGPTMTEQTAKRVETDPNAKIQQDWDPQHVWMTGFTDNAGVFKLEGGAQSKEDVTQLSKRMQASVYFEQVNLDSGDRVFDKDSGLNYYKFAITGKVAY